MTHSAPLILPLHRKLIIITSLIDKKYHLTLGMALRHLNFKVKIKQGNREDMREIHVTRQFFEARGRQVDLIEKTKNLFLDKINGSMC